VTKGDIVLVSYPFTDSSGAKNRPAIVLFESELDVILCFLTTKIHWQEEYDIMIEPTMENGLKSRSLARVGKIITLDKELILGRIGSLERQTIRQINDSMIRILRLLE